MKRLLAAAALLLAACGTAPLAGTDLGSDPAPDFTLQDAVGGSSLTLSALRGKAVALTFLYTQCPDTCPLTAETLRSVRDKLGGDAARLELVAVSVDPARDTPAAVRAFSEAHRLSTNWHYLIGSRDQLAAVWARYGVRAAEDQGAATVTHSDAIYLIDPQGRERTLLHTNDAVEDIVRSVRAVLR